MASAAPPAAAPGRPHPTYTNMITYALAQLGGASARSAIAGFIAARFTGLPVSHDALLSAHLRRLVAEGLLCTSGFSYLFSSSDHHHHESNSPDSDSDDPSTGRFHFLQSSSSSEEEEDDDDAYTPLPVPCLPAQGEKRGRKTVAGGVRRGRGRPRKVVVTLSAHTTTAAAAATPGEPCPAPAPVKEEHSAAAAAKGKGSAAYSVTKPGRGRPRKLHQVAPPSPSPSPSPSPGGGPSPPIGAIKTGPTKEDQQSQQAKPPATALSTGGIINIKIKRGRGRPRKEEDQQSQEAKHPPTPTASSTGGIINIKRGRGRPRKEEAQQSQEVKHPPSPTATSTGGIKRGQQSQAAAAEHPPTPTASSTGGIINIKRGRGRPRKEEQQSRSQEATKTLPTPPASSRRRGIKVGCGRPMLAPTGPPVSWRPVIIDKHPPETAARCSVVDATPSVIKRPRGRPRMYRLSAETGDAAPAPQTGAATPAETGDSMGVKRAAHGWPIKENPAAAAAMSGETGDIASAGIKIGEVENPTAAISAQAGDVGSTGIKRGGEQLDVEMPAAAMSAQAGDARPAELSGRAGIKRGHGRPRKDKTAAAAAMPADAGSAGIKRGRGRPRKEQPAFL